MPYVHNLIDLFAQQSLIQFDCPSPDLQVAESDDFAGSACSFIFYVAPPSPAPALTLWVAQGCYDDTFCYGTASYTIASAAPPPPSPAPRSPFPSGASGTAGVLPYFTASGTASATTGVVWAQVPVTLAASDTLRVGTSEGSQPYASCSGDTYLQLYGSVQEWTRLADAYPTQMQLVRPLPGLEGHRVPCARARPCHVFRAADSSLPSVLPDCSSDGSQLDGNDDDFSFETRCSFIEYTYLPPATSTSSSSTSSTSSSEGALLPAFFYLAQGCYDDTACSGQAMYEVVSAAPRTSPPLPPSPAVSGTVATLPAFSVSATNNAINSPLVALPASLGISPGDSIRRAVAPALWRAARGASPRSDWLISEMFPGLVALSGVPQRIPQ